MAALVALAVLAAIIWAVWSHSRKSSESFYTCAAVEEPTRSYTPYVGTVPVGPWGVQPWVEAHVIDRGGQRPQTRP